MTYGEVVVVEALSSLDLQSRRLPIYDREIGIAALHVDAGAEHYLVRYPPGLTATAHRHTAAHTMVVLEGRLAVNGRVVEPFAYCHFPAGEVMHHAPAGETGCLFVLVFDAPFDVEPVTT